jgi:DNA-binding XRE family transcriptional regulator
MKKPTVREMRQLRKMTQQDLASAIGRSISTITSIEAGRHPPRLDIAREIADYFGVGIGDIEWPAPKNPKLNASAAA